MCVENRLGIIVELDVTSPVVTQDAIFRIEVVYAVPKFASGGIYNETPEKICKYHNSADAHENGFETNVVLTESLANDFAGMVIHIGRMVML